MNLPVFDLHCDTALELLDSQCRPVERLKRRRGHIDLERGGKLPAYAQLFAFFTTPDMDATGRFSPEMIFDAMLSNLQRELQENREQILKQILVPLKDMYDFILIDCSPSLGLITVNALTAADSVIIPVQCEYFALEGISKLLNTIKIIKSKLNPALEIEGFLLTMYDSRLRLANQIYEEVKRPFRDLVFTTVIQRNVTLTEASSYGKPVLLYDAESKGALNHMQLAQELIDKNK